MLDFLKRINWAFVTVVLLMAIVWAAVGWMLYNGLERVQ